jgi:hypothetical protein
MPAKIYPGCFILFFFACAVIASADEIYVDVKRQQGNLYEFKLSFLATASVVPVMDVLTDYEHLHTLNPSIQSSRLLVSDQPDIPRVEVISRNCMLFFCKTLTRVEDVYLVDKQSIKTMLLPEMSNFKEGEVLWTFTPEQANTRVTMQGYIVPDFWVPPLIGPHTIKKRLRYQLRYAASKVNELANTSPDD